MKKKREVVIPDHAQFPEEERESIAKNRVAQCSECGWRTPVNIKISLPAHGDLVDQALERMATTLTFECPECGETEFTVRFPHRVHG